MTDSQEFTKKLFLRLNSNGSIELDRDYLWDGCDTPEIDPGIELTPVSILKLTKLLADLYLNEPEQADIARLELLLKQIKASGEVVEKTIKAIKGKFP